MNEWLMAFIILYSCVSIYYALVNAYAIEFFQIEIVPFIEDNEEYSLKKYMKLLPLVMAILSIFWPILLIIKKFIRIEVFESENTNDKS